jgi:chromosome segregation ATPase
LGYKSLLETFDVDTVIKELTHEYEAIKARINLRADESYVQVIEGYRSMSNRKNHLETERNSIVLFIEEIVKEKENVFMDAFFTSNRWSSMVGDRECRRCILKRDNANGTISRKTRS